MSSFRNRLLILIMLCLYPSVEVFAYFVYCGIFFIEQNPFSSWTTSVCVVLYCFLLSFKITQYLQLQAIKNRSTIRLFPSSKENSIVRMSTNLNPFIVEEHLAEASEEIVMCNVCDTIKPPRTHHCDQCNRCFLKYDHHNYFLGLCIGFHNYKIFYQFLATNTISCITFLVVVSVNFTIREHTSAMALVFSVVGITLVFIEAVVFAIHLSLHTWLIHHNETTVEFKAINEYIRGEYTHNYIFQEGPMKNFSPVKDRAVLNPYNLGQARNWREVFGDDALYWALPVFSSRGNGASFKTNEENIQQIS